MERLLQDLRFAWRLLWTWPGITAIAVASLALGIGANATIFSMVDALLLRPLPVAEPARLVSIFTRDQKNPGYNPSSHLNWRDLRDQSQAFQAVLGYDWAPMSVGIGGGEAAFLIGQMVSGNYFDVLGVRPALGRGFTAEDDREGAGRAVTVLSDGFWREKLGADPRVLGQTIAINNHPFTVIGVAPRELTGVDIGGRPELWVPMAVNRIIRPDPNINWYGQRRGLSLFALGRLKPGVTLRQAQAEASALSARLERDFPKEDKGRAFALVPLAQAAIGPDQRQGVIGASTLLLVVVGLVLLIACANVANLLLARASARRKEIAIRLSLGAGRNRLVRQLLTESLLLALLGGALGLLLAAWADRALLAFLPKLGLPVRAALDLRIDFRVIAFALGLALLTGLLFGLVPALQTARPELVGALKSSGGGSSATSSGRGGRRRLSGRNLLVAGQVALSMVALVAAGLFLRSLAERQRADVGFEADHLVRLSFNLGLRGFDAAQGTAFLSDLTARVGAVPGVAAATVAQAGPFQGSLARTVFVEGQERNDTNGTLIQVNAVAPRYFETLGVPVVRGRAFTPADRDGAPRVAVINQFLATKLFAGREALGQRIRFYGDEEPTEIVGVAKVVKYNAVDENPQPYIYLPFAQHYTGNLTLIARTGSAPGPVLLAIERTVHQLDRQLPVTASGTLREILYRRLAVPRLGASLLGLFGALALLLAAVGIYGVMSFSVAQRSREIGVRMALGARSSAVLTMVLRQGLLIVAAGLAVGLMASFAVSRLAVNMLYGISPNDPVAFGATVVLLVSVALAATYVPAYRATAVDPILVLRQE